MTPAQRAVADRVKRGRPPQRSPHWTAKAKELARLLSIDTPRVLDVFDELAALHEYDGETRAAAEHRAWNEVEAILRGR